MPIWTAPLDPAEYKSYIAQFQPVISTDTIATIAATVDAAGTTAGLVIDVTTNPPQAINDPVLGIDSLLSAVELYFSFPIVGDQSNTAFSNAGTTYNVTIRITTTTTASIYEEDWLLTIKNSGAPSLPWSFDPTLATNRDKLRIMTGDVDIDDQLLGDAEIDAYLVSPFNLERVAATLCRIISAKFARLVSSSADSVRISVQQKFVQYRRLAIDWDKAAVVAGGGIGAVLSGTAGVPIVTGISLDEIQATRDDQDRRPNAFQRGQFDHPGVDGTAQASIEDSQS